MKEGSSSILLFFSSIFNTQNIPSFSQQDKAQKAIKKHGKVLE